MQKQELLEKGYRQYTGTAIDVYFNKDVCIHSGVCVQNLKEVFDLKRKPWILADNAPAEEVAALIDRCPSGALQYVKK